MSAHKQGITKALEYLLFNLKTIQKELLNIDSQKKAYAWAIGGLLVTLTANLMKISENVINSSLEKNENDAKQDLVNIKEQFNHFIDKMISNQDLVNEENKNH